MEIPVRPQGAAATIVEYSDQKRAVNRYPDWIVFPPVPSRCCMGPVRGQHRERAWPFLYIRCRQCGYTVRRFKYTGPLSLTLLSDVPGPTAGAMAEFGDGVGDHPARFLAAKQAEPPGTQSERGGANPPPRPVGPERRVECSSR